MFHDPLFVCLCVPVRLTCVHVPPGTRTVAISSQAADSNNAVCDVFAVLFSPSSPAAMEFCKKDNKVATDGRVRSHKHQDLVTHSRQRPADSAVAEVAAVSAVPRDAAALQATNPPPPPPDVSGANEWIKLLPDDMCEMLPDDWCEEMGRLRDRRADDLIEEMCKVDDEPYGLYGQKVLKDEDDLLEEMCKVDDELHGPYGQTVLKGKDDQTLVEGELRNDQEKMTDERQFLVVSMADVTYPSPWLVERGWSNVKDEVDEKSEKRKGDEGSEKHKGDEVPQNAKKSRRMTISIVNDKDAMFKNAGVGRRMPPSEENPRDARLSFLLRLPGP